MNHASWYTPVISALKKQIRKHLSSGIWEQPEPKETQYLKNPETWTCFVFGTGVFCVCFLCAKNQAGCLSGLLTMFRFSFSYYFPLWFLPLCTKLVLFLFAWFTLFTMVHTGKHRRHTTNTLSFHFFTTKDILTGGFKFPHADQIFSYWFLASLLWQKMIFV